MRRAFSTKKVGKRAEMKYGELEGIGKVMISKNTTLCPSWILCLICFFSL